MLYARRPSSSTVLVHCSPRWVTRCCAAPFGIEITRHKRSGGIRHIEISARPESARRIAPIAPNAPNAAAAAENMTTDCATTRPIAPGASEGGGGRGRNGRNGRNSTASFWETDEGTSPPPATSNAPGRHSWAGVGSRAIVHSRCVGAEATSMLLWLAAGAAVNLRSCCVGSASGFTPGLLFSGSATKGVPAPLELQSRQVH